MCWYVLEVLIFSVFGCVLVNGFVLKCVFCYKVCIFIVNDKWVSAFFSRWVCISVKWVIVGESSYGILFGFIDSKWVLFLVNREIWRGVLCLIWMHFMSSFGYVFCWLDNMNSFYHVGGVGVWYIRERMY